MKLLKLAIALMAVVAVILAGQGSSSAHADRVYHGNDVATVRADHYSGYVCDQEADGHAVWGIWYAEGGIQYAAYDNDGSVADCAFTDGFVSPVYQFVVCEEYKGCREEKT